jgi:hypothetical protein
LRNKLESYAEFDSILTLIQLIKLWTEDLPILTNILQGKYNVAALCHQLLNELGADSFGETGKNSYSIQRSADALTVESLQGDRQIILQVKGQEIEFANLSEFDIQQFEQAWQHRSQAQQQSIDSQAKIP